MYIQSMQTGPELVHNPTHYDISTPKLSLVPLQEPRPLIHSQGIALQVVACKTTPSLVEAGDNNSQGFQEPRDLPIRKDSPLIETLEFSCKTSTSQTSLVSRHMG